MRGVKGRVSLHTPQTFHRMWQVRLQPDVAGCRGQLGGVYQRQGVREGAGVSRAGV